MSNSSEFDSPLPPQTLWSRFKKVIFGAGRNLQDPSIFHRMSLVAFFAWVGLGADGLSSSAYGPEEAYRTLGTHTYLALFLVFATAATVFIISFSYSKIIENFPHGGGGYVVATKLLGNSAGVVSGCALLVDYILTITVSIASGGDALFSLLPLSLHIYKLPVEFSVILFLIVMNLRGVKESVLPLVPIFLTFIVTHFALIFGGILIHLSRIHLFTDTIHTGFQTGIAELGGWGLFLLFLRAYSLGGGTYTGIEAVSNGVSILRDPKVETGKRTMTYMAISLAVTAGGLLLCYLLSNVHPVEGQTLNTVLASELMANFHLGHVPVGAWLVLITIASEAILLLVAAQTGFIDGPRVMANMALDSWLPRRFASLSDRLTMQNGILLIGLASIAMLAYTQGKIGLLVVMYSINVFLTFSLSQLGMIRFWFSNRKTKKKWKRNILIQAIGFTLCASILGVMIAEKFWEGAWVTIVITFACIGICFLIRRHYQSVVKQVREIEASFTNLPSTHARAKDSDFDMESPTAAILVGGNSNLGNHIFLNIFRIFPGFFKNVVFVTVGVFDADLFKGTDQTEVIKEKTQEQLNRYVDFSSRMGIPARSIFRIGTEVVKPVSELCVDVAKEYDHVVFFAGELVFEKPQWYQRILHNEAAYAILQYLRFAGLPMIILPIRIRNN